ncbi:MAG: hypothetical protein ACTSUC_16045 [Promethearchaeota archaeon]
MNNIRMILCLLISAQSYLCGQNWLIGIKGGTNSVIFPPALHGWGINFPGKQIGFEIDYTFHRDQIIESVEHHLGIGLTYQVNELEEQPWLYKSVEIKYLQVEPAIRASWSWFSLRTGMIFQKGFFDFESTFKTALLAFIEPELRPRVRRIGLLIAYKPVFHFRSKKQFIDYYGHYLSFGLNYTF